MKKLVYVFLITIMCLYPPKGRAQVAQATCAAQAPIAASVCSFVSYGQIVGGLWPAEHNFLIFRGLFKTCMDGCKSGGGPVCVAACHLDLQAKLTVYCGVLTATGATTEVHLPWFDGFVMDLGAEISRGVQVAIKYLLGKGNEIVADLVYDGGEGGAAGGCGGAYTGDNGSADPEGLTLNAVASSITDIPAEAGAYPDDIKVQNTDVGTLADLRIKEIVRERAALDSLSDDKWAVLYRAQQRSIQAMTDALVMKKAYKELSDIANKVSSGSYGNYSEAASMVATRRLLLDALMALHKRVIAARVRARAETMEMDIKAVSTEPKFVNETATSSNDTTVATDTTVAKENSTPEVKIEDYGLGENKGEENASK